MKRLKLLVSVIVFTITLTPVLCLADIADQLTQAAMENDIQKVNELIAKGADVNAKSHYGLIALYCAAWNGHTELIKLLIAKGADVNEKSGNGETALSIAESKKQNEVIKELIQNRSEIVQLLIEAGAKEDKKDVK